MPVVAGFLFCSGAPPAQAKLGVEYQMALGNPTEASTDPLSRTNYLLARPQYALSYNDNTRQANWASWSYSAGDIGEDVARTDAFAADTDLPTGYTRISSATFGGDWDRGHICPSEDRVFSITDNRMTFRMSNMMPQASANNRGPWSRFEAYCRELAADGGEVLIMAGPTQFTGTTLANGMAIPGAVWKVAVVVTNAASTNPAASRVSTASRVIAILIPNTSTGLRSWQDYIVSVEEIERVTGFNFLSAVETSTAIYLKNVVDTGMEPNQPTVITSFSPTSGTPGTTVNIQGFHFGSSPEVRVNGIPATVISTSATNITVTLNNVSAGTGPITVTGAGGTDTSYANFTVFSGTQPGLSLSTLLLQGFSGVEGKPGGVLSYTVSGANLTGPITVTAPVNFEVSHSQLTNSFGPSLNLNPTGGSLTSLPVYVRIKSGAVMGSVTGSIIHSGGGISPQSLVVSGTVASSAPSLTLSATNLSGFFGILGKGSASRSYLLSGANLSNSITLAVSGTNYEISLNNTTFASTLNLTPSNEAIASVPIYIRLSSNAVAGNNPGSISHSGADVSLTSVGLSGEVISWNYLVAWNFFGTNSPTSMLPSSADGRLDGSLGLFRGTGARVSDANNSFRTEGFKNDGISTTNTDYFEFSLSATDGKSLSLSRISARLQGTSTFVTTNNLAGSVNQFAYSVDGSPFSLVGTPLLITNLPSAGAAMSVDLSGVGALQNLPASSTVTFRFYASGQTQRGGWGFFSDTASTAGLALEGAITDAPPVITSVLAATGTIRANMSYQITADNSPTWFGASGLPLGLAVDPVSGLISGAPRVSGSFTPILMASNAVGMTTANLDLAIQEPATNPVILAKWTFENATNTATNTTSPSYSPEQGSQMSTATASSTHQSGSTAFTLPSGNGSSKSFSANQWRTNDYFQFTFNSLGYRKLNLSFDQTSSETGPLRFKIIYSTDGSNFTEDSNLFYEVPKSGSAAISWSATVNPSSTLSFDLTSLAVLNHKTNLVLRLVQRDSTSVSLGTIGTTGTSRIDNVEISGVPIDTNAPVLLLSGSQIINQTVGGSWSDPGISAIDAEDVILGVNTSGGVNPSVLGSYVLTYSATDSSGNIGTTTRTVNVVLNNSNSMTIDSDNNGMADLVEYALGGAATGNAPSILPNPQLVGTNLKISFLARTNDSSLVIRPVVSTNLSESNGWGTNGIMKTAGVATNNGFELQTWETPVGGSARKFLKINISR